MSTRTDDATGDAGALLREYLASSSVAPLFIGGDAAEVLRGFPGASVDCVMTSPPYWGQREYNARGIGDEPTPEGYVGSLLAVMGEVRRVLKPTGSLWLNIGDVYRDKCLLGLPWRVALALTDRAGWVLRNEVVWHKVKGGPDNTRDRLRTVHETIFHLVLRKTGYFYDADAIRTPPRKARVVRGVVVSATGVTGVRYRRQIELSTVLDEAEKAAASEALDAALGEVARGEISDFRMIIRGRQRATHSDAEAVSGRARELARRGFYVLRYHPSGAKPGDVWDILPEDTQRRRGHFAPFPEDLCRVPILATCPRDGVVLDPFCGTGTTNAVAASLGRKSVGIDVCDEYLQAARARVTPCPGDRGRISG
jgi:DNA modification methylase